MAEVIIGKVGVTPQGDWSASFNSGNGYDILDEVLHNHDSWISKVAGNKTEPGSDATKWFRSTEGGYEAYQQAQAAEEAAARANLAAEAIEETEYGDLVLIRPHLLNGTLVPMKAETLEAWADGELPTKTQWDETIRTTAGDNPIESGSGARLVSIRPKSDFYANKLITTGYNQLRIESEGGWAKGAGTGFAFPVPKCSFGEYGTAMENNGIVFTSSEGENLTPTVYFKPLADGAPTSATDGTQLTAKQSIAAANEQGGIWVDHSIAFYLTPGPGWLIVSGITRDAVCAHFGWEDWYDKYVAVSDEADGGSSVVLDTIFSTIASGQHSGLKKMLVIGTGNDAICDYAEWISDTQVKWYRRVGYLASPSWTNTAIEADGETKYLHELNIATTGTFAFAPGGKAEIVGQTQELTVNGTKLSYEDDSATALSGAVKYELATVGSGTLNIGAPYGCNDCGIEMLTDATGEAWFVTSYVCNIADWMGEFASHRNAEQCKAVAEAVARLTEENKWLRQLLGGAYRLALKAQSVDTIESMHYGVPDVLIGSAAGAPAAANTPQNWDEETMGKWQGVPRFVGQRYVSTDNKWYSTKAALTNSTADWVALN